LSVKRMQHDRVHGYDVLKLSDLSTMIFVTHDRYRHDNRKITCKIGPYEFYEDVLIKIKHQYQEWIKHQIQPLYIDEIGILELQGECFASILHDVLKYDLDAFITVREDLVDQVIDTFDIKEYDIIPA